LKILFLFLSLFVSTIAVAIPLDVARINLVTQSLVSYPIKMIQVKSLPNTKILIFKQIDGTFLCFAFIHTPSRTASISCEGTTRQERLENINID